MHMDSIAGRSVWIVVRPWDYRLCEVMAVFEFESLARQYVKDTLHTEDDSGTVIECLSVVESFIE